MYNLFIKVKHLSFSTKHKMILCQNKVRENNLTLLIMQKLFPYFTGQTSHIIEWRRRVLNSLSYYQFSSLPRSLTRRGHTLTDSNMDLIKSNLEFWHSRFLSQSYPRATLLPVPFIPADWSDNGNLTWHGIELLDFVLIIFYYFCVENCGFLWYPVYAWEPYVINNPSWGNISENLEVFFSQILEPSHHDHCLVCASDLSSQSKTKHRQTFFLEIDTRC